ncbi:MAG: serine hydrolase domain-containing protein [Chitinophagales bacterium]
MKNKILMKNLSLYLFFSIVFLSFLSACATHTPPNLTVEESIDELMTQLRIDKAPGCAITVIQQDSIIYSKGFGLSNVEKGTKNTPNTIFDVGSISKSFTAACIAKLIMNNKLSLDSKVKEFFPTFNEAIGEATIKHLLHHTSGLRSNEAIGQLIESPAIHEQTGAFIGDDEDHISLIEMQQTANYAHGKQFTYNNTGYWLLGQIVEKVSGESLEAFSKKQIFTPLGMKSTSYEYSKNKNLATGYHTFGRNEAPKVVDIRSKAIGDGGVYSTTEDMAKWTNEMCSQKIFGSAFWKLMLSKGTLNNSEELDYGAGIFVKKDYGNTIYSHGGLVPGYFSMFRAYPKNNVSVIVLTNHTMLDATQISRQVSDIVVPKKELKVISLSAEELKKYEGEFFSEQLGWFRATKVINDTLVYVKPNENDQFPILPLGNNEFLVGKTGIMRFAFSADNKKRLTLINPGMMDRVLHEKPKKEATKQAVSKQKINLEKYIGKYKSDEFGLIWKVYLQEEQLQIDVISFQSELKHINDNLFNMEGRFNVQFVENKDKSQINAFILDFGQAKNIKYSKI